MGYYISIFLPNGDPVSLLGINPLKHFIGQKAILVSASLCLSVPTMEAKGAKYFLQARLGHSDLSFTNLVLALGDF